MIKEDVTATSAADSIRNANSATSDRSFTVPPGFKEAEGPVLFKFEKQGDALRGLFLKGKSIPMLDPETGVTKDVLEIYLQEPGGRVVKFRPSYDVKEKLSPSMVGKELMIRYMSDDAGRGKNGNAFKVFGVWVKDRQPASSDDQSEAADHYAATDADIPF